MIIRGAVFVVLLGLWAGTGLASHESSSYTCDAKWGCNETFTFTTHPCPEAGPEVCEITIHIEPGYTVLYQGRSLSCLDKMEAAMRAMEEQFYYKSGGRMIFPFKPDGEPIRQLPGDVRPLIRQWDAVKRECWKQP